MEYHPYSNIWPLVEGDTFEQLKADIKANGLRMNLITYQGKLLDGRNRERACQAVGVTPRYAPADVNSDDAALKLVISLNEHRRHLSIPERALAGARLANVLHGHNRYQQKVEVPGGTSTSISTSMQDAADMLGVSRGSVARMRVVLTEGTEADVADVVARRVGLEAKAKQLRPIKNPRNGKAKPRLRSVATTPAIIPINRGRLEDSLLTPQQVDPEFTGTHIEFIDKYGHVYAQTAEQQATERFSGWVSNVRALAKRWRELPDLGRPVDHNWLRSPRPSDVAKLIEALDYLRPKIAEAEALLACASVVAKQKQA